jgi:hypothetical protein
VVGAEFAPGTRRGFNPTLTANLPVPVRKWLQHSIQAGTPLARTVWLRMRGQIRLDSWRPFTATQVLAPGIGFIWAATTKLAGIPVLGYDKYYKCARNLAHRR